MTDRQRQLDLLAIQFVDALEAGDFETIDQLWMASAVDPELETVFLEAAEELARSYETETPASEDVAVVGMSKRQMPGAVYPISALTLADADDLGAILSCLIDPDPDPALAFAESCRRLLEMLPTQELRDVAVWKLEGYTNEEIAPKMNGGNGRAVSAVESKLARIRKIWGKEIPS
jgi:hypothetical protein